MDFELSQEQAELLGRLRAVLPTDTSLPSTSKRSLDVELFGKLRAGGFLDVLRDGGRSSVLDAALVVEEVTRAIGIVPIGTHCLVLPLFFERDMDGVAAIRDVDAPGPFRFGGEATIIIRYEGNEAKAFRVSPEAAVHVKSNYVYPLAIPANAEGDSIASAPASAVRRRHRIGISAECVGAMDGLLNQLVAYLSTREQFGRKLGSFQALHHRIAELSVLLEGSRWLSREAAWLDDDETAALAAAYSTKAARRMCWEAHELSGARGFSVDFGMYQHSLRLQALSVEAGSIQAHADDAAQLAWLAA